MRVVITGGSGFIGTNVVEQSLSHNAAVLNLDIATPRNPTHRPHWRHVDILDGPSLKRQIIDWQPTHIVHLAARTDLDESAGLGGYAANIEGVANLIAAIDGLSGLERVIFASSMLVCRNGYVPKGDDDYCPVTLYGESKVIGEGMVRQATCLPCSSVLVRPTSIWGPWFDVPYKSFFLTINKGYYVHPGRDQINKATGFVGNATHQLLGLLTAPLNRVQGKTFYLQDYQSIAVRKWANAIQRELGAPSIRELPIVLLKGAAIAGDTLKKLGWQNPPLTTFRLRNMLTSSQFDMEELKEVVGTLPYSMEEGVNITVNWLRKTGEI